MKKKAIGVTLVKVPLNIEHHYVDIIAENNDGDTPVDLALAEEDGELLIKLIKQADGQKIGSGPLFFALRSENISLLDELIKKNVNLDGAVYFTLQKHLRTELSRQGVEYDLFEMQPIVKVLLLKLLNAGADTTHFSQGYTFDDNAIIFASREGMVDVLNLLLSHGVSVASRNKAMEFPMLVATKNKHKRVVQSLIKYAPSIFEMADVKGHTALEIAWGSGHTDLVRIFLKEGKV